jgi:hypothetical protein
MNRADPSCILFLFIPAIAQHRRAFYTWNALQGFAGETLPRDARERALPAVKSASQALPAIEPVFFDGRFSEACAFFPTRI